MCGSCAPGVDGAAEVVNIRSYGTVERAECDENIPTISAVEEEAVLGNHFWTQGYCVDTVGLDADKIRKYVRYQKKGTGSITAAIV